jgi:hypothetical protein
MDGGELVTGATNLFLCRTGDEVHELPQKLPFKADLVLKSLQAAYARP